MNVYWHSSEKIKQTYSWIRSNMNQIQKSGRFDFIVTQRYKMSLMHPFERTNKMLLYVLYRTSPDELRLVTCALNLN